jgi:hypothetical protein
MKNVIKYSYLIFLAIFITTLQNCKKCDEMCAGLDPKFKEILNITPSTIKFTNGNGSVLVFTETKRKYAEPTEKCFSSYGSCICHECQAPLGAFESNNADTTRKQLDSLGNFLWMDRKFNISIETTTYTDTTTKRNYDTTKLYYYVMGNKTSFIVDPIFKINALDSLITNFSAGGISYNNVIKHVTDTSINLYPSSYFRYRYKYYVTTSYFSINKGLIAFYDNLTQSLFYRTN